MLDEIKELIRVFMSDQSSSFYSSFSIESIMNPDVHPYFLWTISSGALFSNSGGGLNKIDSIFVMLLHACGDSENVGVEYDVLG